ncbi:MAG: molybdopterin cofactor-binding domain-containing protein [Candidatus Limnocylindrales bacterium]
MGRSAARSSVTRTWPSRSSPASELGGRPVKWVEGRRENYQSTIHGRDHITYLEIAGTTDGEVTGLRVKTLANLGGRLSTIGPGIPTTLYARVLSGCYRIPNVYAEVTGVYTNTTFVDAYRGAGRPEATYVIERAMDLFANEIGMDQAELRRRNFIQPDQFPYDNPSGLGTASGGAKIYIDSGDYEPAHGHGPCGCRLQGPGDDEGGGQGSGQVARTRISAPTSRCAASLLRSGSAPSARAGARRCGSRPTSRST